MPKCGSCKHSRCICTSRSGHSRGSSSEYEMPARPVQSIPERGRERAAYPPSAMRGPAPARNPSRSATSRISQSSSSVPSAGQPYRPRGPSNATSSSNAQASYSSTGSAAFDNSSFNAPRPNPNYDPNSGYNNATYADFKAPVYGNTGPAYDSSRNTLSPDHQGIANRATAAGYGDLASRFTDMSLNSNMYSGNHQDVATYGRDREYRTPSDADQYGHYKDVHRSQVEPATKALGAAKEAAPIKGKQPATSHLGVAARADDLARAQSSTAAARLSYHEQYDRGLSDSTSYSGHVQAIAGNLTSVIGAREEADSRRALAAKTQLDRDAKFTSSYPPRDDDSAYRGSSGSSLRPARSGSGVSSTQARSSTESRSNTEKRCKATRSSGKRCSEYTTHRSQFCRDHR